MLRDDLLRRRERVYQYLKTNGAMTGKQLAEGLEIGREAISKDIIYLRSKGYVGAAQQYTHYLYTATNRPINPDDFRTKSPAAKKKKPPKKISKSKITPPPPAKAPSSSPPPKVKAPPPFDEPASIIQPPPDGTIQCKCPRCGRTHLQKVPWTGRGTPRIFCKICASTVKKYPIEPLHLEGLKDASM